MAENQEKDTVLKSIKMNYEGKATRQSYGEALVELGRKK